MDFSTITNYFTAISADWLIFTGLALFFTFDSIRAGASRVTAIAIALPIAYLLSGSIASAAFIGNFIAQSVPAVQTGAFIALSAALFVAFYRISDRGFDSPNLVQSAMAGIGAAVICTLILLQLPEATLPWTFGGLFSIVFGDAYRLFWFVGGYFLIAMSRA